MPDFVTCACGTMLPRIAARCHTCGRERTHRDCYPEQYSHYLVGKRVHIKTRTGYKTDGVVERVVSTRFGLLAHIDTENNAYLVSDCREAEVAS